MHFSTIAALASLAVCAIAAPVAVNDRSEESATNVDISTTRTIYGIKRSAEKDSATNVDASTTRTIYGIKRSPEEESATDVDASTTRTIYGI